jgi:WD40 repeat protein
MSGKAACFWVPCACVLACAALGSAAEPMLGTITARKGNVHALAFSPDGRALAVGAGVHQDDKSAAEITVWEVATLNQRCVLRGHGDIVVSLAFAPDGKTLASASWDGSVRLWDLAQGAERVVIRGAHGGQWVSRLLYTPDGTKLLGGSQKGKTVVWDAEGKERPLLWPVGQPLAFTPGGQLLTWGDPGTGMTELHRWDAKQRKPEFAFKVSCDYDIAVSPDGELLATGKQAVGASLWETATGKLRFALTESEPGDT